ncbi:MAG: hypothetical protein AAGC70_13390 [Pseudomonadota bacterium]
MKTIYDYNDQRGWLKRVTTQRGTQLMSIRHYGRATTGRIEGYIGERRDPETNDLYLSARYYDATSSPSGMCMAFLN